MITSKNAAIIVVLDPEDTALGLGPDTIPT